MAETDAPKRIQRRRTAGWRMPDNTVYVGRGSRWGNPFPTQDIVNGRKVNIRSRSEAVRLYQDMLRENSDTRSFLTSKATIRDIQIALRGKNLACWCPLDQPCHADVLLHIANTKEGSESRG